MAEALEDGYESAYNVIFDSIFYGLTKEDCSFVIDTVAMQDALQRSYGNLADKDGIRDWDIKFQGFDGNNETEYMGYAQFIVEKEERFTTLQTGDDGMNSHMPNIARYRERLERWAQEDWMAA